MLLDIGVGILISIGLECLRASPLSFSFIALGIFFSLIVDLDTVLNPLLRRGREGKSYHHRDILHKPLLFIPAGMIVLYFFNPLWSLLFGLCMTAHFIHDSIGIGWGVQWLYPFKDDHYSFLYQFNTSSKLPRKLVYVWEHGDIDKLEREYGDKSWFRKIYLKGHWYGLVEYGVFLISLVALYLYLK